MNVREAMTPDPATCEPTTTLRLVATLMLDHDCAAVPIVSSGEVLGIVTDRDIACRAVARGWNAAELPASAVMSSPLVAIHPDETFDDAVQVMKENHVHHLPVIDDEGRLLGIVAQSDLGRRMSNRELGQLARETSIRGVGRGPAKLVPVTHHSGGLMRKLTATGAIAAGAAAMTWATNRKDMEAARRRIDTERQVIDCAHGPIEFAECGDGPAVLVIHGAGGGFDQGLELGRGLLGDDYRVVAPSRFGYLGTHVPDDASAEAQADAHLRLLDALQLDSVPVIAASAGAPSAMQFCLNHPDRCSALVLVVPLAWVPDRTFAPPSPFFATVLTTIAASDFLLWTMMKVAPMTLLKTILGTPVEAYRNAASEERRNVDRVLQTMLPISRRVAGIQNDGVIAASLTRYALEDIRVPTLVISAADCLYGTYDSSFYTAEEIAHAQFVGFPSGGHLLLGHEAEVRSQVRGFLAEQREMRAMAV